MSALTVIELWPRGCDCRGCGVETFDRLCWPYYETFLRATPEPADPYSIGYVPVCAACYARLERADELCALRASTP